MNNYHDVYINGVKLPAPSTYKCEFEDLDAEAIRPITTGILKRNRIRSRVAKCEFTWLMKDLTNTKTIFDMLEPETFTAKIYDYRSGKYVDKTMYCSKCGYEYVRTLQGIKAKALTANIIEV